ncbi:hypothetical protein OIU84_006509 [Salix udensis]|uniref:Uncharacterized protein n=1 Tax=Salix udensis TaxID=889485 RepID=A0AAD6P2G7_9ROSI|nr:hypothetical protein OIU84_006509 [Salix udensis]
MGMQLPIHVNAVEFAIESIETIQQQRKVLQIDMQPQVQTRPQQKKLEEVGEGRSGKFTLQQLFQQSKVVDEEIISAEFDFPLGFANSRLQETALVPNFIVGNSVISGVMGSFFLFSGYFTSKHGIPNYWIFMHYISLFKYPFEGFLINEFSNSGKCFEYMFGKCMVSAHDLLREEGYREDDKWRNVVIMVCFILLYRFISYVILRFRCCPGISSFKGSVAR